MSKLLFACAGGVLFRCGFAGRSIIVMVIVGFFFNSVVVCFMIVVFCLCLYCDCVFTCACSCALLMGCSDCVERLLYGCD